MAQWTYRSNAEYASNRIKKETAVVYVISCGGKPLMPTEKHGMVKHMLREGNARVVTAKPFTIQLLYETTGYTQPATLGIDAGYLNIGFSAVAGDKELIGGEVRLLENMSGRIRDRATFRRNRRGRLRHRKNRGKQQTKPKGWLAPSIEHKISSTVKLITEEVGKRVPIGKITVETATFDIQRIMDPDIQGIEYQQGKQYGHINVRHYVFHRDGYKCQNPDCKNSEPKPTLIAHHLRFRRDGGTDRPDNQVTLCSKCHNSAAHLSFLKGWKPKDKGFKPETYMTTVYKMLVGRLKDIYGNVSTTYGYITKGDREALKLPKTHANDAFCIAGGTTQTRCEPLEYRQVRRNNRSLETWHDAQYIDIRTGKKAKAASLPNGRTTRNKNKNGENLKKYRGKKISKGRRQIRHKRYPNQPNDLVKYEGTVYTVKGTHCNGKRVILKETDKSVSVTQIEQYRYNKGFVCIA